MVLVKYEDVDLQKQRFKIVVKKGQVYKEVWKTIKDVAVQYWIEAMKGANKGQYLFSKGLKPGDYAINSEKITRRWKDHTKGKLGVTCFIF